MCLVIEEMGNQEALRSADLALRRAAEPHQILVEPRFVDLCGPARNVGIGLLAGDARLGPILDDDRFL
jgi:hypothetical protein